MESIVGHKTMESRGRLFLKKAWFSLNSNELNGTYLEQKLKFFFFTFKIQNYSLINDTIVIKTRNLSYVPFQFMT